VVASSAIYAGLAIRWVASLYDQEEVLWRPAAAEAPDLLGLRGDAYGRERVPTLPQAVALGVVGLLSLWFVGMPLQQRPGFLPYGLIITLVFLVALPSVAYARLLGCDPLATFRLRKPDPRALAAAVFLALGCAAFALDLQHLQESWTGAIGEAEQKSMEAKVQELVVLGPAAIVLLMAILPGICEEVMFRGFILTGLRREGDTWGPVLVTAVMFATFHLDPARLVGTFTIGTVLGLVVVRSGSLFPAVLMHALYNASVLGVAGYGERLVEVGLLLAPEGDASPEHPTWLLRGLAAVALGAGVGLLLWARPAADADSPPEGRAEGAAVE
jgi:sodium transport system permease protein